MTRENRTKNSLKTIEILFAENKDLVESFVEDLNDEDLLQTVYLKLIELLFKYRNLPRYQMRAQIKRTLSTMKEHSAVIDIQQEKECFRTWQLACINANEEMKYKVALPTMVEEFLENTKLSEREKVVLTKRFGLQNQLATSRKELAKEYYVKEERMLAIESRALRKLKHEEGLSDFADYMDYPTKIRQKIKKYNNFV